MALTEVDICNMALMHVGNAEKIAALTDSTKQARAVSLFYAVTRDEVLASYPWQWARKRVVLAVSADPARSGWGRVYAAPADLLLGSRPRIWNGQRRSRPEDEIPFAVEPDVAKTGFVILTDMEPSGAVPETQPELHYTRIMTTNDVAIFPATFVRALAWRLAEDIVPPLMLSASIAERAAKMYAQKWAMAITVDSRLKQDDPPPVDSITASRGHKFTPMPVVVR